MCFLWLYIYHFTIANTNTSTAFHVILMSLHIILGFFKMSSILKCHPIIWMLSFQVILLHIDTRLIHDAFVEFAVACKMALLYTLHFILIQCVYRVSRKIWTLFYTICKEASTFGGIRGFVLSDLTSPFCVTNITSCYTTTLQIIILLW